MSEVESRRHLRIEHEWTIERFQERVRETSAFSGPVFKLGKHEFSLQMEVEPDRWSYSRDEFFFELKKLSPMTLDIEVFSFRLIGSNDSEMPICIRREVTVEDGIRLPGILRSKISPEFLAGPGNDLRIRSVLEIRSDDKFESSTLANDFRNTFNGTEGFQRYSDFTIICSGQAFPVHRVILAARSLVFSAMFEKKDFKEEKTAQTTISDIGPEELESLIRFAYTDSLEKTEFTVHLLTAADKYDFGVLLKKCEEELIETLSADNAINVFIAAYLHGALKLKLSAMRYIATNFGKQIGRSSELKRVAQEYPKGMLELLEHACVEE